MTVLRGDGMVSGVLPGPLICSDRQPLVVVDMAGTKVLFREFLHLFFGARLSR